MDQNDPRLTAYVLGELTDSERLELEGQIADSSELQQEIAQIRQMTESLFDTFDKDMLEVGHSEIGLASATKPDPKNRNRLILWAAAASIAFLACAVATIIWQNQAPNQIALVDGVRTEPTLPNVEVLPSDSKYGETPEDLVFPGTASWQLKHQRRSKFSETEPEKREEETDAGKTIEAFAPNLSLLVGEDGEAIVPDETRKALAAMNEATEYEMRDLPETQNMYLSESLHLHDRRVEDPALDNVPRKAAGRGGRPADFLSGGEVPLQAAISGDVGSSTFDDSTTTQRASDVELIDLLMKKAMLADDQDIEAGFFESIAELEQAAKAIPGDFAVESGKFNEQYRASFDIDQRITQAEIALQVAMQRFGPNQPNVKALRNTVVMWHKFGKSLSANTDALASRLLRRVSPSGTKEIKIRQLEIDPTIETQKFLEIVGADSNNGETTEMSKEGKAAVTLFRSFADDPEKKPQRTKFIEAINKEMRSRVAAYNKKIRQLRGWKRVKAVNNTSRLMVGDRDELDLTGMQVQVQVDGFRARVLVDYFYYNDRDQQLEGNFKIRLPDDSSLYYFAFGESAYDFTPERPLAKSEFAGGEYVSMRPGAIGLARQDAWKNVKEARVVPREKAAFAYKQTVRRRVDPALVEWSGAGIFNARVFPLAARKLHRIVIGYDVNLTPTDDGHLYRLDLPEQTGQCQVDLCVTDHENGKWKLHFDGGQDNKQSEPAEWKSGRSIGEGKSQKRMRFDSPKWKSLVLSADCKKPLILNSPEPVQANRTPFFATQFRANIPEIRDADRNHQRAVFMVDTSLSSRPEKFNAWLDLMKATLKNNRGELQEFAVLFFDVDCRFWRKDWTKNNEAEVAQVMKDCFQIGLEGATNLHGAIQELSESKWLFDSENQPTVFLLSDGAANWGETDLKIIQRDYADSGLGNLFAYQTGLSGTAISNLRYLANSTGGAVFSVASEDEIEAASVAHRNKPWQLVSLAANGGSDLMTAGRVQWVYPGQWLTVVGRGNVSGPINIELQQGQINKTMAIETAAQLESEMAGRLYGQVSVGQLEALGNAVFDVAASYARHFRITGQTCSLLMLETEADYQRFNIVPEEDWFVVQSKNASAIVKNALENQHQEITDAKTKLIAWLKRLESMEGIEFKMPTAFKLALESFAIESIDCRLNCKNLDSDQWSKKYVQALAQQNLDASLVATEANRRLPISSADAIRAHSNLVESHPGDWVVARDVAFTAMDLNRPDVAYHLLLQVIRSRPFEGSAYACLAKCLQQLGKADMAIIFYELSLEAKFQNQGPDFRKIVATSYLSLLRSIERGELKSNAMNYVSARAKTVEQFSTPRKSDLIISMMWNTDQTDVDLHILEPSGEECFYQNATTKSGGSITADITTGFGPEMYILPSAPEGEYQVKVKYFASNQNRTKVNNKVYLSIFTNYGTEQEEISHEVIELNKVGEKELVKTIRIGK